MALTQLTKSDITLEMMRRGVAVFLEDFPQMHESLIVEMRDSWERMGKELIAFTDLPMEPLKVVKDYATFRTPKTWFQHFKARHFSEWLLEKFPVEYHEEKVEVRVKIGAVYPQLPEVYPRNLGTVRYSYLKNSPISVYPPSVT